MADRDGPLPASCRRVLEMVAAGAPLEQTLAEIAAVVERQVPDSRCAIIACGENGVVEVVVAPGLPARWREVAIEGRTRQSGSALVDSLREPRVVAAAVDRRGEADVLLPDTAAALSMTFPLQVDGSSAGAMAVYSHQPSAALTSLGDYAQLAAVALSRLHAEHRLHAQMSFDPATGLPNARNLHERIAAALQRRQLGFGAFVAILSLELPRLAEYNATFGRAAGDEILRFVATAVSRSSGPATTALRVAGGRFLLIAEGASDVGEVVNAAHKLAHAAAGPVVVMDQPIVVEACVGVAIAGDAATSATQLLAEAEAATAQAQRSRLDKVAIFDPEVARVASDRLIVELGLQRALAHDELEVYYQPIHAVADGALVAAEALLRWRDPESGLRPPADFVPIAEDSGLIRQVTKWVLGQVCQQIAHWQRIAAPPIQVSVNVSATELHDPGLVVDVQDAVTSAGIRPELLCLELTETAVMDDPQAALHVLATLKDIGVRLAIDDFGTGYSSLAYLRRLPIDYVKIDASFIHAMPRSAEDEAIVGAVIDLTTTLGLPAVAEGVETGGHLDALRRLRCRYAQGFHWSPAVPPDVFDAMRLAGTKATSG